MSERIEVLYVGHAHGILSIDHLHKKTTTKEFRESHEKKGARAHFGDPLAEVSRTSA